MLVKIDGSLQDETRGRQQRRQFTGSAHQRPRAEHANTDLQSWARLLAAKGVAF